MSVSSEEQQVTLLLPSHIVSQLDELVRRGYFHNRQEAVIAAVERLRTEDITQQETRQQALTRLCGALSLGTTRQSLRQAELDRLAWESEQR